MGRSFLSLFDLFELNVFRDVLLVKFHVNLGVWIDVDHSFLIGVLITSLREVLFQGAFGRRRTR
jgi:hypothetical protein